MSIVATVAHLSYMLSSCKKSFFAVRVQRRAQALSVGAATAQQRHLSTVARSDSVQAKQRFYLIYGSYFYGACGIASV